MAAVHISSILGCGLVSGGQAGWQRSETGHTPAPPPSPPSVSVRGALCRRRRRPSRAARLAAAPGLRRTATEC